MVYSGSCSNIISFHYLFNTSLPRRCYSGKRVTIPLKPSTLTAKMNVNQLSEGVARVFYIFNYSHAFSVNKFSVLHGQS